MDLNYAEEKFTEAVINMAKNTGSLEEKIHGAFLIFNPVREADLPEHLRGEYRDLKAKLVSKSPEVRESLRAMSLDELCFISDSIVNFHIEVIKRSDRELH